MAARAFWAITGGFLVGVALRSLFPFGLVYAGFFALIACAFLALGFIERGKRNMAVVSALALCACGLGIVRMHVAIPEGVAVLNENIGKRVVIEGVVMAEPDVRDNSVRVMIAADHFTAPSTSTRVSTGVLATLPAHADIHYGERVRAFGELRAPTAFDTGQGRQFAYPHYLAAQGISYELAFAQAEGVRGAHDEGFALQAAAISTKRLFLDGIGTALPEPAAGLAGGITAGDKRSIGRELSDVFRDVGLIHVVVLSGYNITLVLALVERIARSAPRLLQFGASGLIVLFFILMTGGAGSAVRAGLMALVVILARMTGRVFLAGRALGLAAFLIVLWDPFDFMFDPSFQLSALATFGLVVFTPIFENRTQWIPEKYGIRDIVSSTLGTQTAVLPLLLYQNGVFPLYALPANVFALVAVPLAMLFSFIAGIAGLFVGDFAIPIAFPAYILLEYIIGVAKFFASLPFASLSIGSFRVQWLIATYILLFIGAWYAHRRLKIAERVSKPHRV